MRNVWVYYFSIIVPFVLLLVSIKQGFISNNEFVALLFLYVLYRQFTDVRRLIGKGVIEKATWKLIANPMLQVRYFKELYWLTK